MRAGHSMLGSFVVRQGSQVARVLYGKRATRGQRVKGHQGRATFVIAVPPECRRSCANLTCSSVSPVPTNKYLVSLHHVTRFDRSADNFFLKEVMQTV